MGIRLAESADRVAVEAIVQAAYEPWVAVIGARPLPLTADYGELISQGHVYVLENGEIDALIVLEVTDGMLLVENVAVRPDRQGRGLGRRLMAFAEFRARSLGLTALRLYTNAKMTSNIGLYESLGYRETGREAKNGRSVVHMRKKL
ncbi:GNAT family N-acetyltransferase [Actinoallomurus bryophytorum]|uniref:Acetyltransferase (GNAT) family protein n=1 Tax=Actinoallomurus bryophytorum TaxID=1490222 RepID=A0A543CMC8_9ACTN|nr:GNAT family N-acetyltransferase [Actinoallomurus bryophytorum]TQL98266.1 acetyltransferase (GNAT) family protein [Actinoallomurus bryophytorum]